MRAQAVSTKPHVCDFCGNGFTHERTLVNHICEKKRRHLSKDEPHARIGFQTWLKWYELTNTQTKKDTLTYAKFMNSNLYLAFVRFGHHVVDTKLINPEDFIVYVITNSIKLDDWCKDSVYENYIRYISRKEHIETALERQVKLMDKWGNETGELWTDFFEKVNTNIALNHIRAGRISPWIILNSSHAENLINRMSDEQLMLMDKYIEVSWWQRHMARNKADYNRLMSLLKEYDI